MLFRKNLDPFGRGKFLPMVRRKISYFEIANLDTKQPEGGMANGGGHFTDLSIFAFDQFKGDPRIGNGFSDSDGRITGRKVGLGIEEPSTAGESVMVADRYSLGEPYQGC